MTEQEIVWEDPPNPTKARGSDPIWVGRLAPLRERPGEWARVGRFPAEAAYKVAGGYYVGIEKGEYEAVGRGFDKTTRSSDLYVRYVGKPNLKSAAS